MNLISVISTGLGIILSIGSFASNAQGTDAGKREYDRHCAACHGKLGKGNGPYAANVHARVADLTALSKRNIGVFPSQYVYEVIDGRQLVAATGAREMPVWGNRYRALAAEHHSDGRYDQENYTRTRILALTEYVNTLQQPATAGAD